MHQWRWWPAQKNKERGLCPALQKPLSLWLGSVVAVPVAIRPVVPIAVAAAVIVRWLDETVLDCLPTHAILERLTIHEEIVSSPMRLARR
jgi:hypothetical protein